MTLVNNTDIQKRHGQLVNDSENGDCFRACVSYLLDVPNSDNLPNDHTDSWFTVWTNYLLDFDIKVSCYAPHQGCWTNGLWIAVVPSKNYPDQSHAIIMLNDQVEFDPNQKRRYHKGIYLDPYLVQMGYHFRYVR